MKFACCGANVPAEKIDEIKRKFKKLRMRPYPINRLKIIISTCPNCGLVVAYQLTKRGALVVHANLHDRFQNTMPCCQAIDRQLVDVQKEVCKPTRSGARLVARTYRCGACGREIVVSRLRYQLKPRIRVSGF